MDIHEYTASRTLAWAALNGSGAKTLADSASSSLPSHLRQRLPDAQAHATRQLDQVRTKLDAVKRQIEHDLTAALSSRRNFEARYDALLAAVEKVTSLVGPKSACRRGCTHCCHIPVAITQVEAEVMAKRIGVKVRHQAPVLPASEHGYGYDKPCPFLANGSCSIYAHRPVPCRLHFNMDQDDLLCQLLPETTVPVPWRTCARCRRPTCACAKAARSPTSETTSLAASTAEGFSSPARPSWERFP